MSAGSAVPPVNAASAVSSGVPQPPSAWWAALRSVFPTVLRQEAARWGFVLRTLLGAFLALGVSMLMQLEQPSTAMLTVLIVMQPQSGAVLAKSLYRMLGNFAGGAFAVLLFSLFAQQPVLLLAGMALWVAFCTIGSTKQRNAQSYGFVLAGYTACIIALPEMNNPANIFIPAMLRVSEVFVGILCAAVTSEAIFPESVHRTLYSAAQGRFTVFDDFVRRVLAGSVPHEDVERMQQRFINDVATLDAYGASASFEAAGTLHKERVRLFNTGFMTVSTSFYSLYSFMHRLSPSAQDPLRRLFDALCADVAQAMAASGQSASTGREAVETAAALAACRQDACAAVAVAAGRPGLARADVLLLEVGQHLLCRFIDDMRAYLMQYAALTDPQVDTVKERAKFSPGIDGGIALISGLRAALVLVLVSLLWWGTGWNGGSGAAIFAVVFCALQAAAPNPVRSVFLSSMGCVLGTLLGMIYTFVVMPNMTDFPTLCAALFPFLAIGPYLATIPAAAGPGRSYNFMFAAFANPGLFLNINPADLVGGALAKLLGIAVAGAMLAILLPSGGNWWKKRLYTGLLRQGAHACRGRLEKVLPRFESGVRDILLQFSTNSLPTPAEKEAMLRRTLAMSELGRIIVDIRRGLASGAFAKPKEALLRRLLGRLDILLHEPNLEHFRAVLTDMEEAVQDWGGLRDAEEARKRAEGDASPVFRPGGALPLVYILRQVLMRAVEELQLFDKEMQQARREKADAA